MLPWPRRYFRVHDAVKTLRVRTPRCLAVWRSRRRAWPLLEALLDSQGSIMIGAPEKHKAKYILCMINAAVIKKIIYMDNMKVGIDNEAFKMKGLLCHGGEKQNNGMLLNKPFGPSEEVACLLLAIGRWRVQ
ncbi:hypothetical protein NDU88_001032 [Pleurodeles waltl]|uniref:Uncharacterized protein n=1 Tax=Pleurodeles waltl TaxID=8319 RepID=A0AAV7Q2G2_PLEWA|nr:hypothetical protein NDU88_001032 [Pleurodeles waltl]